MSPSATWTNDVYASTWQRVFPLDRDASLRRLELLGRLLDDALVVPGTNYRVGWDGIIGLVPGVGDALTTALSAFFLWEAYRLGAGRWTLAKMLGNVAVDALVGVVPVLGDLADLGFKANRRNLALLRRALAEAA